MEKITTQTRTENGKGLQAVRIAGNVPAVAYGPKFASTSLSIDNKEFRRVFNTSGYSNLIELSLDGKTKQALIKEVQMHPVTREFIHVSFYVVDMDTEIEAQVPVIVVGIAPAVKNNLGFLEIPENTLTLKSLPKDLPAQIEVDVTKLEQVGDAITAKDLNLGEGVTIVSTLEDTAELRIVFIAPPQKEVVETEAVAAEGEEAAEAGATDAEASA